MTQQGLRRVRFFTPAFLAFFYYSIFALETGAPNLSNFDFSKLIYSPVAIFFAVIYQLSRARNFFNSLNYNRVNENIRSQMVAMTPYKDDKSKYKWDVLKTEFYRIIDNDNSLSEQKHRVYENGAIWTACIDSLVISIGLAVFSVMLYSIDVINSMLPFYTFLGISLMSVLLSMQATSLQIALGNEQLDAMRARFRRDIDNFISKL